MLDEADMMLQMGFQEDVEEILKEMPENKQTTLWSATMPRESGYFSINLPFPYVPATNTVRYVPNPYLVLESYDVVSFLRWCWLKSEI